MISRFSWLVRILKFVNNHIIIFKIAKYIIVSWFHDFLSFTSIPKMKNNHFIIFEIAKLPFHDCFGYCWNKFTQRVGCIRGFCFNLISTWFLKTETPETWNSFQENWKENTDLVTIAGIPAKKSHHVCSGVFDEHYLPATPVTFAKY